MKAKSIGVLSNVSTYRSRFMRIRFARSRRLGNCYLRTNKVQHACNRHYSALTSRKVCECLVIVRWGSLGSEIGYSNDLHLHRKSNTQIAGIWLRYGNIEKPKNRNDWLNIQLGMCQANTKCLAKMYFVRRKRFIINYDTTG